MDDEGNRYGRRVKTPVPYHKAVPESGPVWKQWATGWQRANAHHGREATLQLAAAGFDSFGRATSVGATRRLAAKVAERVYDDALAASLAATTDPDERELLERIARRRAGRKAAGQPGITLDLAVKVVTNTPRPGDF